MIYQKKETCRACGSDRLKLFLSLGPMPLANAFLRSESEFADEAFYPLDVCFCQSCSLVQLADVIDPEALFRNYIYVTGTSDTIAKHNIQYARTLADLLGLGREDLVVEVASNDGSLLKCFKPYGAKTLGVEPATNIAEMASADGVETVTLFFNSSVAREIREEHGRAKAVIANNVLAHVDDTRDFLLGCRELLDEGGLAVVEVPYVLDLIERLEYDTIYHEHLCYFSVSTLARLCDAVGLSIQRMDHVPVHGGSLRMYAAARQDQKGHSNEVLAWLERESCLGLTDISLYERFASSVEENRKAILYLLNALRAEGKVVAAYGAPAKGNTLLNYCGIDPNLVPYTVDKNPMKVGLYTPGMHIPVLAVSTLLERQPDYVLMLAWNFAAEIIEQQQEYRNRGGQFIIPIPKPRIV
jgi:hypothetical protein